MPNTTPYPRATHTPTPNSRPTPEIESTPTPRPDWYYDQRDTPTSDDSYMSELERNLAKAEAQANSMEHMMSFLDSGGLRNFETYGLVSGVARLSAVIAEKEGLR